MEARDHAAGAEDVRLDRGPVGEIGGRFDPLADPVRGVEAVSYDFLLVPKLQLGHALVREAPLRPLRCDTLWRLWVARRRSGASKDMCITKLELGNEEKRPAI